jgi:hypothetical protein
VAAGDRDVPVSEQVEATSPDGAAEMLHAAAEVLRRATRAVPRGPWRWGNPDVGDDEPGADPHSRPEPWPVHLPHRRPSPLDEPVPPGLHDPYGPLPDAVRPPVHPHVPSGPPLGLDPALADSLAALLERHAERIGQDDRTLDGETARAAVAVARSVLRSGAASARRGPEGAGPA